MTTWEYLIVEFPSFEGPTHAPGASAAVHALNNEGEQGWEAVGLTPLARREDRCTPQKAPSPVARAAGRGRRR
jgi:hypothetical protein